MTHNILPLNKTTLDTYLKCFENNQNIKDKSKIEWQFFKHKLPIDFVVIANDDKENRPVGIYAMAPVKFQINGETHLCAQSLDTITDINYRGQGVFTKLANISYQKAQDISLSLVYGFPNGNSIHGFKKKLEWEVLDPVPFLIKPLNTSYFTNKFKFSKWLSNVKLKSFKNHKSKYTLVEKFEFPEAVNSVWDEFSKDIKVAVKRDKTYLDWRYIDKPNEDYKILHAYNENNDYLGFVVYTVKTKHGGKIGYIMELIYKDDAGKGLLREAVKQIANQKADTILSWCLEVSPNYEAFKSSGFFNLPEKLRPIELHFGARGFGQVSKDINQRNNWYLSYSDSDTV